MKANTMSTSAIAAKYYGWCPPKNLLLDCLVAILLQFNLCSTCYTTATMKYVARAVATMKYVNRTATTMKYASRTIFTLSYDVLTTNQHLCSSGQRNRTQSRINLSLNTIMHGMELLGLVKRHVLGWSGTEQWRNQACSHFIVELWLN